MRQKGHGESSERSSREACSLQTLLPCVVPSSPVINLIDLMICSAIGGLMDVA